MRFDRGGADRLAGLRAAQMHDMPAAGFLAKIMIEGQNAMHFGDGQIQLTGNDRHRIVRNETQLVLDCVQNGHQGTGGALQFGAGVHDRILLGARHEPPNRTHRCCVLVGHGIRV